MLKLLEKYRGHSPFRILDGTSYIAPRCLLQKCLIFTRLFTIELNYLYDVYIEITWLSNYRTWSLNFGRYLRVVD